MSDRKKLTLIERESNIGVMTTRTESGRLLHEALQDTRLEGNAQFHEGQHSIVAHLLETAEDKTKPVGERLVALNLLLDELPKLDASATADKLGQYVHVHENLRAQAKEIVTPYTGLAHLFKK